jgi:hypothetical protein
MEAFVAGLKIAPKHISLRNNMGLALVMNGEYAEGVRILEAVAADPAADRTSHHNLQLAYGMVTAAKADAEASAIEQADSGFTQETIAAVEPVMVETESQIAAANDGDAPAPLVPEMETERALATTGKIETPIEVTLQEDSAAPSQFEVSPLRVQTARAVTGDAVDANVENANPPSAYMGAYLTADAGTAAARTTPATGPATTPAMAPAMAPKASEPQVAALQPMTPATSGGDYVVQLASYRSEARAMLGWSELRGNAPDLLGPVSPVVRRAELGEERGTVYRLRTAPTAKTAAATLCSELKALGMDCLVIKETPSKTQTGSHTG